MIETENLSKTYKNGIKALDNVSFTVRNGEICGFIGKNGAGKSTTAKILSGILEFETGKVIIDGLDAATEQIKVKEITGYVPESSDLFNSLTAEEFLDFTSSVRKIPDASKIRRINYFSEFLGFNSLMKESIGRLSKGNRQKVLITSSLLHNPDILILDEPLNGLDAETIIKFQDMIILLAKKGKCIFYCSHLLDIIEKISSKIIIIESGKILLESDTGKLTKDPGYKSLENLFREISPADSSNTFSYEEAFS